MPLKKILPPSPSRRRATQQNDCRLFSAALRGSRDLFIDRLCWIVEKERANRKGRQIRGLGRTTDLRQPIYLGRCRSTVDWHTCVAIWRVARPSRQSVRWCRRPRVNSSCHRCFHWQPSSSATPDRVCSPNNFRVTEAAHHSTPLLSPCRPHWHVGTRRSRWTCAQSSGTSRVGVPRKRGMRSNRNTRVLLLSTALDERLEWLPLASPQVGLRWKQTAPLAPPTTDRLRPPYRFRKIKQSNRPSTVHARSFFFPHSPVGRLRPCVRQKSIQPTVWLSEDIFTSLATGWSSSLVVVSIFPTKSVKQHSSPSSGHNQTMDSRWTSGKRQIKHPQVIDFRRKKQLLQLEFLNTASSTELPRLPSGGSLNSCIQRSSQIIHDCVSVVGRNMARVDSRSPEYTWTSNGICDWLWMWCTSQCADADNVHHVKRGEVFRCTVGRLWNVNLSATSGKRLGRPYMKWSQLGSGSRYAFKLRVVQVGTIHRTRSVFAAAQRNLYLRCTTDIIKLESKRIVHRNVSLSAKHVMWFLISGRHLKGRRTWGPMARYVVSFFVCGWFTTILSPSSPALHL